MTENRRSEGIAEIERIRSEYAERDERTHWSDWKRNVYHPRHAMGRLFRAHHTALLTDALNELAIDLQDKRVLDVGCGHGHFLRQLIELGADPERLVGIDLSADRIAAARRTHGVITWLHTNEGTKLPFDDHIFDVVAQSVVFSSIVDDAVRRALALEMTRVLAPGGYVFWRDLKRKQSPKLDGFSLDAVQSLFSGCMLVHRSHADPREFRTLYRHPWLAHTLHVLRRSRGDSWFFVLRKES